MYGGKRHLGTTSYLASDRGSNQDECTVIRMSLEYLLRGLAVAKQNNMSEYLFFRPITYHGYQQFPWDIACVLDNPRDIDRLESQAAPVAPRIPCRRRYTFGDGERL